MNEHSKEFKTEVQPERAIGVSLSVQTSEDTSLVFQTHFGRDSERSDIREVLDLLNGEAQRLKFKTLLPQWRDKLEGFERSYERAVVDMAKLDERAQFSIAEAQAGGRRNPKIANNLAADREKAVEVIRRWTVEIAELKKRIVEAEKVIGE